MKQFWNHLKTVQTYKDNVLNIEHKTLEFTKINRSMPFTVVNTRDWVIILPKITDGNFIMVKQYRIATDQVTLEFPGGTVNTGEDFKLSAIRELKEETGLTTKALTFLGEITPNPALMSNKCYVFFADNCEYTSKTDFDDFEDIEIIKISQNEIEQKMRDGDIAHSIILAAYNLYKLMPSKII